MFLAECGCFAGKDTAWNNQDQIDNLVYGVQTEEAPFKIGGTTGLPLISLPIKYGC